ncbi:hypothetical protein [Pontibacter sp. SGAir0037]|uniref:hypothetical protein n=1 Tax=Pontibacter sp. SGAir0037 TaxID=2571030 RepID=UPI0010CCF3DE|nr:hypothetical protein [Pontibacter sp. SGAir0037]QCR22986.1 hypothetical protein C1N53_11960 [Pontibacter sp. SGAir0037]
MAAFLLLLIMIFSSKTHVITGYAANEPTAVSAALPDTLTQLSKVWVLRERLQYHQENLKSAEGVPELELIFFPNNSYQITRLNPAPNAFNGKEVTETGIWKLEEDGHISVQVKGVDGRAIQTAKLYRWHLVNLQADKLVLKQIANSEYLVFEKKHK